MKGKRAGIPDSVSWYGRAQNKCPLAFLLYKKYSFFGLSFGRSSHIFSISLLTCKPCLLSCRCICGMPCKITTKNSYKNASFQTRCLYLCLQDQGPLCGRLKGVSEECLCETVCETPSLCSSLQCSYDSIQSAKKKKNYHLHKLNEMWCVITNVAMSGHLECVINSPRCPLWEAVVVPVQNTLCLSVPQGPDWETHT